MGFTRKRFNDEFNEIIEFVREASFQDGYNLETSLNEKCNGNCFDHLNSESTQEKLKKRRKHKMD